MRKIQTSSRNIPARLLSRLMVPKLEELTSQELLNLFIDTAKQFEEAMFANAPVEEMERLQAWIALIKDEIYKKSNLSPEGSLFNGYFHASFINKN